MTFSIQKRHIKLFSIKIQLRTINIQTTQMNKIIIKNIIQAVKLDNDLRRYKIELRKFVSQKMTILKKIGLFQ